MNISLAAEPLLWIGSLPVTNATVMTVVVSVCIIIFSFVLRSRLQIVPQGLQNVIEIILEAFLNLVKSVIPDKKKAFLVFPLVVTIFLFVLLSNWTGLLPGMGTVGVIGEHHGKEALIPFIRAGTADLNLTVALAFVAMIFIQAISIATVGLFKYAGKFFVSPFKKPYIIGSFVGLLELISEFSKVLSFSFRLFGNIFAGEVLLMVILFLVPYFLPVPFLIMEIFVGIIQAFVFAILVLVFSAMAIEEGH